MYGSTHRVLTVHSPPQLGHVAARADPALSRRHRRRVCRRRPERTVVRVAGRVARGGAHRGCEDVQATRPPTLSRRVRRDPRGRAEHSPGGGGGASRAPAYAGVGQRGLQLQRECEWEPAWQAPAGHTLERPAQLGRGRLPVEELLGAVSSPTLRGSLSESPGLTCLSDARGACVIDERRTFAARGCLISPHCRLYADYTTE